MFSFVSGCLSVLSAGAERGQEGRGQLLTEASGEGESQTQWGSQNSKAAAAERGGASCPHLPPPAPGYWVSFSPAFWH